MTVACLYRDSLSLAYVLWLTGALKHGDDGGKENHKRSTTKQQGLKQEYKHRVSDWELRTCLNNAAQKHFHKMNYVGSKQEDQVLLIQL